MTVYQYNGSWPRFTSEEYFPDPVLTEIYDTAISRYPTFVKYDDGIIGCLQWNDEEPLWVRNFKRGILSITQLKLPTDWTSNPTHSVEWEVCKWC